MATHMYAMRTYFFIKLAKLHLVINQKHPGYVNWFKQPVESFQVATGVLMGPLLGSTIKQQHGLCPF